MTRLGTDSTLAPSGTHACEKKASVLIVDDEPQVLVALQDLLSEEYLVHAASSPEEALEHAIQHDDVAVVISDQRMPGMAGDELLSRLSKRSSAERILVTGYADLNAVARAVNQGRIFAYVTKPWRSEDLQLTVHRAAERFRLARELAHERQLLQDLMGNVPDGIYFKDPQLHFIKANAPIARMLNRQDAASLVGQRLAELPSAGPGAEQTEAEERRIIDEGVQVIDVIREYGVGANRQWFSETKAPVRDSLGAVIGLVGISRNVTERIEANHARRQQQERIVSLTRVYATLSGINGAIVRIHNRDALLDEACQIAVREGQFAFAAVVACDQPAAFHAVAAVASERGRDGSKAMPAVDLIEAGRELSGRVATQRAPIVINDTTKESEYAFAQRFADCGSCSVAGFPLFIAEQPAYAFVLCSAQNTFFDDAEVRLLSDLAENISFALGHLATKARLDFLAYYDELTQLPNQRLFLDRLQQQLAVCHSVGRKLALVVLDINRFRHINETLGRRGGDALLREVGKRLRGRVQEQNLLARLASNRFAVMVPLVDDEAEVGTLVESALHHALSEPFVVDGIEIRLSGRAGISVYPSDGSGAETLVSNAEAAATKARLQGRAYVFYAPSMNARVADKLALETRLGCALQREEFLLHYQPKVDLKGGEVVGIEALIRWQDSEGNLVAPGLFIPSLEETGLILEVGRWVLMRAAAQYAEWSRAGKQPPRIAVNVSALQLGQPGFLQSLEEMQATHELAAHGVDLEITESVFVHDLKDSIQKLTSARRMGFQVALDDFGTGYSSLAYLSRLPIDVLKIDRSFISRMTRDPQDMALVTAVISLAHSLDCKVVAEGVERPEQAQLLRLLRCDQMQGYLIGKPIPASAVEAFFGVNQAFIWKAPADEGRVTSAHGFPETVAAKRPF